MKKQSRSFEIALSAIACAVASLGLTLGSYVRFLLAAGYLIAVFALMVPLAKGHVVGFCLAFAGSVLLAFLFTGFVLGIIQLLPFIVFFGLHPLVNSLLSRVHINRWIKFAGKWMGFGTGKRWWWQLECAFKTKRIKTNTIIFISAKAEVSNRKEKEDMKHVRLN